MGWKTFIAWKVTWSRNGYVGWDHESYFDWLRTRSAGFGYVREHGFGHEWWNFYEGFHDEYYFGYAPIIHSLVPKDFMDGGVIFFLSRHPAYGVWFLVGIYGGVSILSSNDLLQGTLLDHVPEKYRGALARKTLIELKDPESIRFFKLMAKKELSTPMPTPMPVDPARDLGVNFGGRGFFRYVSDVYGLSFLDKVINFVEDLTARKPSKTLVIQPDEALMRLRLLRQVIAGAPASLGESRSRTRHAHTYVGLSFTHAGTSAELVKARAHGEAFVAEVRADRVERVADALSLLGWEGFVRLDRAEPEYRVLSRLYWAVKDVRTVLLIGIGAAVVDYQLGAGGAPRFWSELDRVLRSRGYMVQDLRSAHEALEEFMQAKVNARLRNFKLSRIHKLFYEGFAHWLWVEGYRHFRDTPLNIWWRLAKALNTLPDKKTVVFAMKVLDLISAIVTGEYAEFPKNIPLPVDFHIARMTAYSGIIDADPETLSKDPDRYRKPIINAWTEVVQKISNKLGKHVSTLRLDSLLWQLDRIAMKHNYRKQWSLKPMVAYLTEKAGISENAALTIVKELTARMPE